METDCRDRHARFPNSSITPSNRHFAAERATTERQDRRAPLPNRGTEPRLRRQRGLVSGHRRWGRSQSRCVAVHGRLPGMRGVVEDGGVRPDHRFGIIRACGTEEPMVMRIPFESTNLDREASGARTASSTSTRRSPELVERATASTPENLRFSTLARMRTVGQSPARLHDARTPLVARPSRRGQPLPASRPDEAEDPAASGITQKGRPSGSNSTRQRSAPGWKSGTVAPSFRKATSAPWTSGTRRSRWYCLECSWSGHRGGV